MGKCKLASLLLINILLLINPALNSENKYLSIPFKLSFDDLYSKTLESEEEKIISLLSSSEITIETQMGSLNQKLTMKIVGNVFYMYFISSDLNNGRIDGFDRNSSNTYRIVSHPSTLNISDCIGITEFQEYLTVDPGEAPKSNYYLPLCEQMTFKGLKEAKYAGIIGMDITYRDYSSYSNMVGGLKGRTLISEYDYFFEYTTINSGYLIIGSNPFNVSDKIKEEDYIYARPESLKGELHWSIFIHKVQLNNHVYDFANKNLLALFEISNYYFTAPKLFYDLFKKDFFQEYFNKNLCYEKVLDDYIYFYCDNKADLSKFKKMKIVNNQQYPLKTTFFFESKDLFQENNGKKYFLVRFDNTDHLDYWILGQVFLRKYKVSFNQDTKMILLPKIKDEEDTKNEEENPKEGKKSYNFGLVFMLIIIIVILLVIILRFVYLRIVRKDRRIRANELQDNYIYENLPEIK